jgi:hypothetical protein
MKTKILEVTRRGAASALFAALIPAAIALPLVSGCAVDEPATDTASQQVAGADCTVLRPVGWSSGSTSCHEFTIPVGSPPILFPLPNGQSATFTATPGGGFGRGSVTLQCQDGFLAILHKSCSPAGGGGEP